MLESAKLKAERAQYHIRDLQRVFDTFVGSNPHSVTFQADTETGNLNIDIRFKVEPPKELPLILGDAVHNLRCALDHITWEIIGIDRGTQDRWTKFPTGRTAQDYETNCKGLKTPRVDTKDFFVALACYKGGNGFRFWSINELDNSDKHVIVTPIIRASRLHIESARIFFGGRQLTEIKNQTLDAVARPDGTMGVMGIARGGSIEFDQPPKATTAIYFNWIDAYPSQLVIPTLAELADAVTNLIGRFEQFVSTRGP